MRGKDFESPGLLLLEHFFSEKKLKRSARAGGVGGGGSGREHSTNHERWAYVRGVASA